MQKLINFITPMKLKQSIKTIAFTAAKKIVSKEIDETTHQHLIDEAINEGMKHES